MTPAEEKNLAFVLDWWRKVIEARHTELAANYAAEDLMRCQNQRVDDAGLDAHLGDVYRWGSTVTSG